jgi:NAD(P)-dependent dehydrogenase (short-subunit alcohol dehydrogenase family)
MMLKNQYALEGRIALVTGGSRNIGRAIAVSLGRAGAHVAVNYRAAPDQARSAVAEIEGAGSRALAVQSDVVDPDAVARMVDHVEAELGPISILVNNAGVARRTPFLDMTVEEWDWMLNTNLRGYFLVGQAVARRMVAGRRPGAIINIGSRSARIAKPNLAHYEASKAGVTMLTRAMALALAPYGIRVNQVDPGFIATDLNRSEVENPQRLAERLRRVPLGRVGAPEEVAGLVLFLASDDAGLMTGASVAVDGGSTVT